MKHPTFPPTFFVIAGTALAMSVASLPAIGVESERRQPDTGSIASSSASTVTSSGGSQGATVVTRTTRDGEVISEDCRVVESQPANGSASGGVTSRAGESSSTTRSTDEGLSSTVRIPGSQGLSSTTRVPGGSSVTVHSSGSGSARASASSSSSSGGSSPSSEAMGAGRSDDCVILVDPAAPETQTDR